MNGGDQWSSVYCKSSSPYPSKVVLLLILLLVKSCIAFWSSLLWGFEALSDLWVLTLLFMPLRLFGLAQKACDFVVLLLFPSFSWVFTGARKIVNPLVCSLWISHLEGKTNLGRVRPGEQGSLLLKWNVGRAAFLRNPWAKEKEKEVILAHWGRIKINFSEAGWHREWWKDGCCIRAWSYQTMKKMLWIMKVFSSMGYLCWVGQSAESI